MITADVMAEFGEKLAGLPDTVVIPYWASSIDLLPAAMVHFPSRGMFDQAYARGLDILQLGVTVFISKLMDEPARDLLSQYTSGAGPRSVREQLGGPGRLWRSCDVVTVTEFSTVRITWNSTTKYLAAVFSADAQGGGT